MYLRPQDVFNRFLVEKRSIKLDGAGRPIAKFEASDGEVKGVMYSADRSVREKFKGLKHEVSGVVIQYGGKVKAKVGDRLVRGAECYYIEGIDDLSRLARWVAYFVSERGDK